MRDKRRLVLIGAVAAAVVALGLVFVFASGDDDGPAKADIELPEGFERLDEAEFYQAMRDSQLAAETFHLRSQIRTEGAAAEPPAEADVQFADDGQLASHLRIPGGNGRTLQIVLLDGRVYVAGLNPGAKPWWQVNMQATEGLAASMAQLVETANPQRQFEALQDPERFALVGPDDIGDTPAVRYSVTLDVTDYYTALGRADEAALLPDPDAPIDIDLWLDAENRPIRTIAVTRATGVLSTTTIAYSDYGQDVEVVAPPAAKVTTTPPKIPT
ncbi:hypothetical protein [Nocardioides speluncae]|uniref:hypothetical protein n=1 Tax=Nocardioides speluncae TaxID=2670337 RepID=UPI0012B17B34|nr:hypothetical protein [Nocardioides speluncae]